MRIQASNAAGAVAATAAAPRRMQGTGFSVSEEEAARSPGPAAGLRTVGGIDALIALQGVDDPTERRRHALKRGRLALDALDELKLGLLDGSLAPATLTRLRAAAAFLKDGSGDVKLDGVLGEIELRVAVEIAKTEARPA
jgi:hypothetical protein